MTEDIRKARSRQELRAAVKRMTARVLRKVASNGKSHINEDLTAEEAVIVHEEMLALADCMDREAAEEEP